MKTSTIVMIKSYVSALALAEILTALDGKTSLIAYGIAALAAVGVPLLRALDKNNPGFGLAADKLQALTTTAENQAK